MRNIAHFFSKLPDSTLSTIYHYCMLKWEMARWQRFLPSKVLYVLHTQSSLLQPSLRTKIKVIFSMICNLMSAK